MDSIEEWRNRALEAAVKAGADYKSRDAFIRERAVTALNQLLASPHLRANQDLTEGA
jgi:hypothetical protein